MIPKPDAELDAILREAHQTYLACRKRARRLLIEVAREMVDKGIAPTVEQLHQATGAMPDQCEHIARKARNILLDARTSPSS